MTGQRPFRFGVQFAAAGSREEWLAKANKAEQLGYATLLMPDHFGAQFAVGPALTAAAAATKSLRLGTFVLDNDFRHPALVAAEAATIDLLSEGRFELGLGAGWLPDDYSRTGLSFDPGSERVGRLEEALRIIKGLFSGEPLTFSGRYYTIAGLEGFPGPVQRPWPPILIGGGGRRLLSIAAREADIVSVIPRALPAGGLDVADLGAAATARKVAWVRQAAGARFGELELNVLIQAVAITANRGRAAEEFAARFQSSREEVLESVYVLAGTADQIAEDLRARRERYGISYVVVFERSMDDFAPVVARLAGA